MKINWAVRIKNKNFWETLIPALLLLVQIVASIFGVSMELEGIGGKLLSLINAAFAVLAVLGVVNDPTTQGLDDSGQAMTYTNPK